ncbi:endonuclease/exonuclease/phosphatase family protein [Mucilaginibacter litoreus]|uniref:Endonuclease/exonuclease/phosphatase family protein n=1 Tax=Mucilaginibacter litoreus TaxID=1048221 RepID=A0ABW3AXZ1_9SPHI
MSTIRNILFYLTYGCGILLIIITLIAHLNTSQWYLEVLAFPCLLILIVLPIFGLVSLLFEPKKSYLFFIYIFLLITSEVLQVWSIFPYTPIAKKRVRSATPNEITHLPVVGIIVSNVLMSNRNADLLLKLVSHKNPTLILTMEVDRWWVNKLDVLNNKYPYRITFPTDNTYGMCLYSQYPLTEKKIFYLNNERVPSFLCKVTLNNGIAFQLLTVHPVAPKPSKHPDNMGKVENGLIKAAYLIARREKVPTMVAGDFNDVGWSYNTAKFRAISKLNDVRCGRGLYNTFRTNSLLLKWPLDYVYVSDEFRVVSLEKLANIGSDHYPFYAQLTFSNN